MKSVVSALKLLRYFDRLIIRGKRMLLQTEHRDPCTYTGHEEVLGYLTTYCNDREMKGDEFVWTPKSVEDLEHITKCPHCLARVFSTPDKDMADAADKVASQAS